MPILALSKLLSRDLPPGYLDALRAAGTEDADTITLSKEAYFSIRDRFGEVGLGDCLHHALGPVVRVLDAVAGTSLAACGSCAQRAAALNGDA